MTTLAFFVWLNNAVLALPSTLVFMAVAVILTLKLRFAQIRLFPRFIAMIHEGLQFHHEKTAVPRSNAINKFHALFTAMATTIGMGNVVGPTVAIYTGGPGALFWLVIYIFFAAATKFTEVAYAVYSRIKTPEGKLIGGPMEYLKLVHPWLASWYVAVMTILFIGFSTIQSNTLANIFAQENVPNWVVGLLLVIFVAAVLHGGAARVGLVASRMVPCMFVLYVSFAIFLLCKDMAALRSAFSLIAASIFSPAAAFGGFMGATVLQAMRAGTYKGIFISEAGIGTSSIPHAMADTKSPTDQGTLAMFSMISDALLSILSGLIVLVTGVWSSGNFRSTLIYEAFKLHASFSGQLVLLVSITLFAVTTVIGNSFNGIQTYASITNYKGVRWYIALAMMLIFLGSIMEARLAWEIMETLLTCVAIPHLLGLLYLAFTKPEVLRD